MGQLAVGMVGEEWLGGFCKGTQVHGEWKDENCMVTSQNLFYPNREALVQILVMVCHNELSATLILRKGMIKAFEPKLLQIPSSA